MLLWQSGMKVKYVTTVALRHPVPQFDVSLLEKRPEIVVTRGEIFGLKFFNYRLAAGLRSDPLGDLKRSLRPLAAIEELTLRDGEEGEEKRGRKNRRGKGREGRG